MKKNKVVAIVQARMGSSRFPGKVFYNLNGSFVLEHVISRLEKCKHIDDIVIATTTKKQDDAIVEYCHERMFSCFRGSEEDVLQRVTDTAKKFKAEIIVDITADCPLIDSSMIDKMIKIFKKKKREYMSNIFPRTWPDGFDVQIYDWPELVATNFVVKNKKYRTHAGWNISQRLQFACIDVCNYCAKKKHTFPEWRLTIDTIDDGIFLDILLSLMKKRKTYKAKHIINFLKKHPELLNINNHIESKIPGEG